MTSLRDIFLIMNIQHMFQQATQYHQSGQLKEAEKLYKKIIKKYPGHSDTLHLLGLVAYQQSRFNQAVDLMKRAIKLDAQPHYYNNLANAYKSLKNYGEAIAYYKKAIQSKSDYWDAHNNLGLAFKASQKYDEALDVFQRLMNRQPNYFKAYYNQGNVFCELKRWSDAIQVFHKVLELKPNYVEVIYHLAHAYRAIGHYEQAINIYSQLLTVTPEPLPILYDIGAIYVMTGKNQQAIEHYQSMLENFPDEYRAYCYLGNTHIKMRKLNEAKQAFSKALDINPECVEALVNMGALYQEQGHVEQTLICYEKAIAVDPNPNIRLRMASILPPVYQGTEDVEFWKKRFKEGVKALDQEGVVLRDPLKEGSAINFYLAYQGGNLHPLQVSLANIYCRSLPEKVSYLIEQSQEPIKERRIKIGFVSRYLYTHSISFYYAKLLELISDQEFESYVFVPLIMSHDDITENIKKRVDHFIDLPYDLELAREKIARAQLDILVYLDIGTEPFTYLLAFTRLATIQCVMHGHPLTTGIPSMDYFISSRWYESAKHCRYYQEKLVLLNELPIYFTKPQIPEQLKSRQQLGLPEGHLYMYPMTPFKCHPEFDQVLANILAIDSRAQIIIFKYESDHLYHRLAERFKKSFELERVHFLPWAPKSDFYHIVSLVEVVLDTFYFGGGVTSFDVLGMGTPVVTWASGYLSGSIPAGFYRRIGVTECIAESQEAYPELACKIAMNPEIREDIKQKILCSNDVLYENPASIRALKNFWKSIVQ